MDRFDDDDNESGADVEEPPDSIMFDQKLTQLKLLQCVYCMEVVSTNRKASTTFRCPKCHVIFKKKDNVNFWETEAGHPGLRLYIYRLSVYWSVYWCFFKTRKFSKLNYGFCKTFF